MPAARSCLAPPALVDLPSGLLPDRQDCTPADQQSLVSELSTVIDGRCPQGLRHPLLPILVVAVWAVMGGSTSFTAIADAAEDAEADLLNLIQLRHPRWGLPHLSTIRRALIKVGVASLEAALRRWATRRALRHAAERTQQRRPRPGSRVLLAGAAAMYALDGKIAKGSAHDEVDATGEVVRRQCGFVSVLDVASGVTLTQTAIVAGDEVAAATTALDDLADAVDLHGSVITADARHTVRHTAQQILGFGAHYVFRVKANTPTLYDLLTIQHWTGVPAAATGERGHARKESRSTKVLNLTQAHLAELRQVIPGGTQVIRMVRTRTTLAGGPVPRPRTARKGKKKGKGKARKVKMRETVYFVTSMDYTQAQPAQLAAWIRSQWAIENRVHYVRDVTLSEDASRVRTGGGPQVMAAIRNTVISLARLEGSANIARTTRRWGRRGAEALEVLLAA